MGEEIIGPPRLVVAMNARRAAYGKEALRMVDVVANGWACKVAQHLNTRRFRPSDMFEEV